MRPAERSIELTRGDAYDHQVFLDPLDAADYTYAAQIKIDPTEETPDAEFAIDISDLATDGVIVLSLEAADTEALEAGKAYRWSLRRTDGDGRPTTLMDGRVLVLQGVTS